VDPHVFSSPFPVMFRKYVYILSGLLVLSSLGTKSKLWLGIGQAFSKREGRGVKTTKKMSKCGSVLSSTFSLMFVQDVC